MYVSGAVSPFKSIPMLAEDILSVNNEYVSTYDANTYSRSWPRMGPAKTND
jgi:hypothetical protein